MAPLNPVDIPLRDVVGNDYRIGHLLGKDLDEDETPRCAIVGFPCDEGVRRNGGRPGSASAPLEIRKQLFGRTPPAEHLDAFKALLVKTKDIGDVDIPEPDDLEAAQKDLGDVVAELLEDGTVPIILGGGHETAFGHFLGYAKSGTKTSILNIDAHTDVRPLKENKGHSGSPFRQALLHESACCERYLVAGLQPHTVAKEHLVFIDKHEGRYIFRDETNVTSLSGLLHEHGSERLMATFDMDVVDQAFAPGVSAPCANGLQPDLWLTAAYLAGRHENVASFDVVEMNPEVDRDGQTARLAALTVWNFMLGLCQR